MTAPLRVAWTVASSHRNRLLLAQIAATPPEAVRFEVIVYDDGAGPLRDDLRPFGVPLHALNAPSRTALPLAAMRTRRLFDQIAPDVVHANMVLPTAAALLAVKGRRGRGPAVVACRHHNRMHHLMGKRLWVGVDRWSAKAATAAVGVSESVCRTLTELEGVPSRHVRLVANGMDWSIVSADQDARERWRARTGGSPLLVGAGRLDPAKDYPTLIRAFARVAARHPAAVLAIAGTGPAGTVTSLRAQAAQAGLADRVLLLGFVEDIFGLIAAADVFMQASIDEAMPQTIMEALGLGVPVAATHGGGCGELLRDWYEPVRARDDRGLAALALRLLDEPDSARATAVQAREAIRTRYTSARMAADYANVYQEAAAAWTKEQR